MVIDDVETLIPAANSVLVEKASASRGRMALDRSILRCDRFMGVLCFAATAFPAACDRFTGH
jgi:hypothetical protein